jgi:hypothetical protein
MTSGSPLTRSPYEGLACGGLSLGLQITASVLMADVFLPQADVWIVLTGPALRQRTCSDSWFDK